jgi:hypothetical protein
MLDVGGLAAWRTLLLLRRVLPTSHPTSGLT